MIHNKYLGFCHVSKEKKKNISYNLYGHFNLKIFTPQKFFIKNLFVLE